MGHKLSRFVLISYANWLQTHKLAREEKEIKLAGKVDIWFFAETF